MKSKSSSKTTNATTNYDNLYLFHFIHSPVAVIVSVKSWSRRRRKTLFLDQTQLSAEVNSTKNINWFYFQVEATNWQYSSTRVDSGRLIGLLLICRVVFYYYTSVEQLEKERQTERKTKWKRKQYKEFY